LRLLFIAINRKIHISALAIESKYELPRAPIIQTMNPESHVERYQAHIIAQHTNSGAALCFFN